MPNAFDQFDTHATAAPAPAVNPFDQFDPQKPSVTEDVLKSGGSGLAKGAVAGVGAAGDVRNLASAATDYLGKKAGASPETIQSIKDTAAKVAHAVPVATPIIGPAAHVLADAPSSGDISHFVGDDSGPNKRNIVGQALDYQPKTTPGKYAGKVGEFVGNPGTYVGPGGLVPKIVTAIGAGLGTEAGGELAKDSKYKPLIEAIGGVIGGHGVTSVPRITPMIPAERQAMSALLQREGVPLTAGDRTGSTMLKAAESELSHGANEAQNRAFHGAAFRRVGEDIGDRPIQGQGGAVDTMMNRIGGEFDAISNRNHVRADPQLVQDLHGIDTTYNTAPNTPSLYPQDTVNAVNAALARVRNSINNGAGAMSGPDYQTLRSNLRAAAQGATDPQRSEALHSVTNALDDAMERTIQRTNPADAGAWGRIRRDYRNALVLQQWAGSANMTPATLAQAAKNVYGRGQYVRGMDDMSDLAEAGRHVMKQYQDSGTPRRLQVEDALKHMGGMLGFLAGNHAQGMESGVGGLLFGELATPFVARPAARAALMNPVTQGALSNQLLPYRFETSPSTIALMNQIRGEGGGGPPAPGARKAKDGKWYVPDPSRPGKYLEARP